MSERLSLLLLPCCCPAAAHPGDAKATTDKLKVSLAEALRL
jgi:hypothetical protein